MICQATSEWQGLSGLDDPQSLTKDSYKDSYQPLRSLLPNFAALIKKPMILLQNLREHNPLPVLNYCTFFGFRPLGYTATTGTSTRNSSTS